MTEEIKINELEYILDWNNGYILIIDLNKSKYMRFWVDDVDASIRHLVQELSFKVLIIKALNNELKEWKDL